LRIGRAIGNLVKREQVKITFRIILGLTGLVVLVSFFYAEENLRGKHAWEKCKQDLEAKGEVLDWNKFIPPPVPDEQNIFKSPKISEWFVKPPAGESPTNELVARLNSILSESKSVVIADLTVEPPSTNQITKGDIYLRYSSFGMAVFLSAPFETNMSSPSYKIPLIQFEDVPITIGIENLARQAGINYLLDPEIGYNHSGQNGEIKPEPVVSVRWENITARQALLALLNQYNLQLVEDSKSNANITAKNLGASKIFVSSDAQAQIKELFQNIIGTNVVGSQGLVFLARSPAETKPARIVLQSETMPDDKELVTLLTQFFPNDAAKNASPGIQVKSVGPNFYRVLLKAFSATNYLAQSDQFESDFDKIREALKRPHARMDGNYSDPITMPIPNYVAVRVFVQTLAQRTQCYLLIGQPEKALDELMFINDSRRLFEGEPTGKPMTLVAALLNVAVVGIYADVVNQGLKGHLFQEAQLSGLEKQLQQINLFPFMADAFREDREVFYYAVKYKMVGEDSSKKAEKLHYNNLTATSIWQQRLIEDLDSSQRFIQPTKIEETSENSEAIKRFVFPGYSKALQVFAYNQNLANEAQIACALERYHLVHGEYPEMLNTLASQFIEKMPHDIIGGQPLHYRRTNDGKYLLYSIGWNEKDDGGLPGTLSDVKNGDWVWQYPRK
jgi:hypothetical protein